MKSKILTTVLLIAFGMCTLLTGCAGGKFEDVSLDVPHMNVSSQSITADGKLITKTAANAGPNDPKGENLSPHLKWDAVEGAACYAVVIFDTTANWLHMFLPELHTTELQEGAFTDTALYVGAYPPKNSGTHEYRLEVFALRETPHNLVFIIDRNQNYKDIVKALHRKEGQDGNIAARGYATGTYAHGDNTAL